MTQDNEEGQLDARNFKIKNAKTGVTAFDASTNLDNFEISKTLGDAIHIEGGKNVRIANGVIDSPGGHGIYYDGNPRLTRMNELVDEIQKYVDANLPEYKEEFRQAFENFRKSPLPAKDGYLKNMVLRLIERGATVFVEGLAKRSGDLLPVGGM